MSDASAPTASSEDPDLHDPDVVAGELDDAVAAETDAPAPTETGPTETAPTETGSMSVEELIETVETVVAERDAHLFDLQRVTADFANFRRQNEKRRAEVVHHAAARLAEALLPVLDGFDAAVEQGVEGVEQLRQQLLTALQQQGLETLAEIGDPFDPHRHEAAMSQPAEDGDDGPVVAEVLRAGYGWNGRVLRAAMVAVRG